MSSSRVVNTLVGKPFVEQANECLAFTQLNTVRIRAERRP